MPPRRRNHEAIGDERIRRREMNIISTRGLEGSASVRPDSEPEGRGIGFEGLLRSEIGATPSREARGEPRDPDVAREAPFEAGVSQGGRTARSSPAETARRREIDEADAVETARAGSNGMEDESARPVQLPGEEVPRFESRERIDESPAPGDVTAGVAPGEVEAAIAASDAGQTGAAAGRTSSPADAAATSGGRSESGAPLASTAVGSAAAHSRSDAGDSRAAISFGSGDGVVRAASDAESVGGAVAERGAVSNDGRSSAFTSPAVEAAAVGSAQETTADTAARTAARAESPAIAAEGGESARARAATETLEARSAGRAASLASGEAGMGGLQGSDRRGAADREGGDGRPSDDRSIDPRLSDNGSSDRFAARAGFDSAIGVGSVGPAAVPVGDATGAATHVQALPTASIGATVQSGVEVPPAGASSPAPAADALAVQTEWLATRGGGSARLVLHPPELGEIAIRVSVRDGSVDVVMIAHDAAAKAIAEEQSDRLAQAFSTRDLRMGSFEVRQAETRAPTEGGPDAQLGNPDARDGSHSRRDPNAGGGGVDRVAGMPRTLNGRPAGLPPQTLTTPAARSVDLRI
jgi:hypothetical protein